MINKEIASDKVTYLTNLLRPNKNGRFTDYLHKKAVIYMRTLLMRKQQENHSASSDTSLHKIFVRAFECGVYYFSFQLLENKILPYIKKYI